MANNDVEFNTYGKIPTDSDFWKADITFGGENGITPFFKKVIGEQVFKPLKRPNLAFYGAFAGRPLASGEAWTEKVIKKVGAKKFDPKADADDALGFYDNGGYEFTHKIDYAGWIPVTLPSELESLLESLKPESVGQLNAMLVDNVNLRYQLAMESATAKKLVSSIVEDKTITYKTAADLIQGLTDIVTEMRGNTTAHNDLQGVLDPGGVEYYNDNIYTNSDEGIYVFIDEKILNWIKANKATLPSPELLDIPGVDIIGLPDGCPTPITAVEFAAGVTAQGWDEDFEPAAMGEDQPDIIICSKRKMEIRPLAGGYKVNIAKNAAGDFENQHLIWKCGLGYRREENGVRVYLSYDESPAEVLVANPTTDPVNTKEVS